MKKVMLLSLVVGLAVALLAGYGMAQDGKATKEDKTTRPHRPGPGLAERIIKEADVSDPNKQAQIRQICETHAQAMENWRKENGAKLQDLRDQRDKAREAGDTAKVKELQAEIRKLEETRAALRASFLKQLGEVLNAEQMAKVEKMLPDERGGLFPKIQAALREMNLTGEQKAKAREIMRSARQEAEKADEPKDRAKIACDTIDKFIKELNLTGEQKAKLEELKKEIAARDATRGDKDGKKDRKNKNKGEAPAK